MNKFLLIILFFPIISYGQQTQCDSYIVGNDSLVYCVTDASCYGSCDGQLEINIYGPNNPYRFIIGSSSDTLLNGTLIDTLCPNTYSVLVLDGNNSLVDVRSLDIDAPSELVIYSNIIKNPSCYNDNNGFINISTFGDTPLSWNWSNGEITEDISSLDSGVYILQTTDGNSCSRVDTFELVNPDKVNSTTITDTLSCIGDCDGTGIVTPSDGVAPYTYQWFDINGDTIIGETNNTAAGILCYGINTVFITDANGCLDTNEVFIENPDTLQLSNITIDSACYQICDGQLSVTIEGGAAPYATEWSLGGNIFNTTDTITEDTLCPGNYQIKFTDANLCVDSVPILLIERDSFVVQDWIIDDSCYNSCTGQITVQLMNQDNPPFTYNWSNGGNDTVISNLCSDTFELVIIDERSCSDTFELFVAPGDSMYFDTVAVTHNSCYGDENGAISLINFNGGILPLDYLWSTSETTSGINSLIAGLYNVTITDANGCSIDSSNIEVSQPDSLFATPSFENVSCFGASDGLIDVDIFGGVEPYFISWDHLIPDSILIDTVPAGEYIYTIVDSNLCTLSDTLIIEDPDELVMSDSIIDVLCKGESTGEIHITVTGGTAPYEYSLNGGAFQSQAYFDNLSADPYLIIVKDANDCLLNSPLYNISEPLTVLSAGLTPPNLLCFGDTGTVVLNVSGGTGTLTYSWTNGITTQDLNGVGAGNYSVTILDANNCELIKDTIVTQPDEIVSLPLPVITNLLCFADGTGSIDISIIGGIAPYDYSWSGPNGYSATTPDIQGLIAGTYVITVTDSNGCELIKDTIVTQPDLLEATYVATHVACFGGGNGEIDITVSGGTPSYTYDWSNLTSSEDLSNILSGNYSVIVTDDNNCKDSALVIISEPSDIIYSVSTIDLVCNNEYEGEILITASGGTPAYSYSIDGGTTYQSGNNFTNLQAANYSVWIQDANGCEKHEVAVLNQPIGYSSDVDIQHVEGCNGDETGSIEFTINGNTPPYTYFWSNGESTASIYDLTAGDYDVTVNDSNNCEMMYLYTVIEPDVLELEYTITSASCEEKNDGAITTIVTGGTLPIYYQWGTGETTADISNLSKGTYSLYIEDSKGCDLPIRLIDVGFDGFNGCIDIPTGFTPNNDNIHDEWVIYGLIDFPDVVVSVYNRWGQEVFSSKGNYMPWDGKHNGVDLPTATYYYLIEINELDKVFNGMVTIKR